MLFRLSLVLLIVAVVSNSLAERRNNGKKSKPKTVKKYDKPKWIEPTIPGYYQPDEDGEKIEYGPIPVFIGHMRKVFEALVTEKTKDKNIANLLLFVKKIIGRAYFGSNKHFDNIRILCEMEKTAEKVLLSDPNAGAPEPAGINWNCCGKISQEDLDMIDSISTGVKLHTVYENIFQDPKKSEKMKDFFDCCHILIVKLLCTYFNGWSMPLEPLREIRAFRKLPNGEDPKEWTETIKELQHFSPQHAIEFELANVKLWIEVFELEDINDTVISNISDTRDDFLPELVKMWTLCKTFQEEDQKICLVYFVRDPLYLRNQLRDEKKRLRCQNELTKSEADSIHVNRECDLDKRRRLVLDPSDGQHKPTAVMSLVARHFYGSLIDT